MAEFRSIKRDYPHGLARFLMIMTGAYGLFLTAVLPWTLGETLLISAELGWFALLVGVVVGAVYLFTMVRWCFVHITAFVAFDAEAHRPPIKAAIQPFVSILVPARNEAESIRAAIESLIALDYPAFEVIVVDDGSTDETFALAKALEGDYPRCSVRAFTKPNGGKWSALNLAYSKSRGELVLCVDADSRLSPDTLWIAVARMERDPDIVGVAGQVTIRTRTSLLLRLQALEYVLSSGGRMCLSAFGLVLIVPGAIGLYRRSALEKIAALPRNVTPSQSHGSGGGKTYGPLSGRTFAEDFELSLSAVALGGKVVYEPRAVAFTKAPHHADLLISQRYRWIRGAWQVLRIYRRELREQARVKKPWCDFAVNASYAADLFVLPVANVCFWSFLVVGGVLGIDLSGVFLWLLGMALLNLMTALTFILLQEDEFALLPFWILMDLYLSILVNSAWVIAAADEARGSRMKWH